MKKIKIATDQQKFQIDKLILILKKHKYQLAFDLN
jgi:hypothetical protein